MNEERRNEYLRRIASCIEAGASKAECVRRLAHEFTELSRQDAISVYAHPPLNMAAAQASTYFYGYHVPQIDEVVIVEEPTETAIFEIETKELVQSLTLASQQAANWYLERTQEIERDIFLSRGGINDNYRGAVYSYHNASNTCYIGITGYGVKSRLTTPTSPHAQKPWWVDWTYMRFLPLEAAVDRQILEYLLILGLRPTENQKPPAINFDDFLSQY